MNPLLIQAGMKLFEKVVENNLSPGVITKTKDDKTEEEKAVEFIKSLDDNRVFWKRKTFWFTVAGVAVPVLNRLLGLGMQIEEVTAAVTPLVAFILGESWRKKQG